jgi:hypothetical protein
MSHQVGDKISVRNHLSNRPRQATVEQVWHQIDSGKLLGYTVRLENGDIGYVSARSSSPFVGD